MLSIATTAGCQNRSEIRPGAARVLFDSLVAAHEAIFDTTTSNLGYDRMSCLTSRADTSLAFDLVTAINRKAETTVRARHSEPEMQAAVRNIESVHPVGDVAFCQRVDSMWYARGARPVKPRL